MKGYLKAWRFLAWIQLKMWSKIFRPVSCAQRFLQNLLMILSTIDDELSTVFTNLYWGTLFWNILQCVDVVFLRTGEPLLIFTSEKLRLSWSQSCDWCFSCFSFSTTHRLTDKNLFFLGSIVNWLSVHEIGKSLNPPNISILYSL